MAVDFKTTQPVEYFRKFIEQDVRPDGRDLGEARPIVLNVGTISTAEGSALVKLGNTAVICGIKAELTTPKSEEPGKGFVVPNVDLPPLCSPMFKAGPPSEMAQAATVFMDSLLTSTGCVLPEDLCIESGKLCWVLYCDLMCLDYDGNLLDACSIALLAALKNTQLPGVSINEETGLPVTNLDKKQELNIRVNPIATTFAVFDNTILFVDPTQEEESISTGTLTVVTTTDHVSMVHKPGGSPLSEKQLQDCVASAQSRTAEVTSLIEHTATNLDR